MKKGDWYKKASNWLIIVACIILVPILLANIWVMIQSKTNKDEVPSIFGIKPFIVLSGSMESEIHKGDLILTKIVDPASLEIEDIIAFRDQSGTVTTHRIIEIVDCDGDKCFITKGDNNNTQDKNIVEYGDVEGQYITRLPSMGSIMNSFSEPITFIILIVCITAVFVIGFTISNRKMVNKERQEFLEYKKMMEEKNKKESEVDEAVKEVKKTLKRKSSTDEK